MTTNDRRAVLLPFTPKRIKDKMSQAQLTKLAADAGVPVNRLVSERTKYKNLINKRAQRQREQQVKQKEQRKAQRAQQRRQTMINIIKVNRQIKERSQAARQVRKRVKSAAKAKKLTKSQRVAGLKLQKVNEWSVTLTFEITFRGAAGTEPVVVPKTVNYRTKDLGDLNMQADYFGREADEWYKKGEVRLIGQNVIQIDRSMNVSNIPMYSINSWTKQGTCVYDTLQNLYKPSIPSLTKYSLFMIFFDDASKFKDINILGVTTEQIKKFCELYNINMYAFNYDDKLFDKYIAPSTKSNNKRPPLMFKLHNHHMFPIINQKKRKSIIEQNKTVKSSFVGYKNKEQEMPYIELPTEIQTKKCHFTIEPESDGKIIEITKLNGIKELIETKPIGKEAKRIIVTYTNNLFECFTNLLINDETFFESYNDNPIKFDGDHLVEFTYKNVQFSANPDYFCSKAICDKKFDIIDLPFKNQSLNSISFKLFEHFCKDFKKSRYNSDLKDIINSQGFKKGPVNECYFDGNLSDPNIKAIDINKCYRFCVLDNKYDYPVFNVFDTVEKYIKGTSLMTGKYYLTSEKYGLINNNPIRCAGWYSREMVEYCRENNIEHTITHQLIAKDSMPAGFFNEFFNFLINNCGESAKLMINSFIGCLNKTSVEKNKVFVTTDFIQASNTFINNEHSYISNYSDDVNKPIYQVQIKELIEYTENSVPIYAQILDKSYIELHKLIVKAGGELLKIHTDCVYIRNPNEVPLSKEAGGYKLEKMDKATNFVKRLFVDKTNEDKINFDMLKWVDINESAESNILDKAKELIKVNSSFGIFGGPGTGKTYLIKQLDEYMRDKGIRCQKLAPTNKAARLIGGTTIHKFLKIGINDVIIPRKRMLHVKNIQYIIIDEISMLPFKFYSLMCALQNITGVKFIMVGDFKQLLPVEETKRSDNFYKESSALNSLCNHVRINMLINKRSDDIMWNLIHNIDSINIDDFQPKIKNINLCWRNSTRQKINSHCAQRKRKSNKNEPYLSLDKIEGDDYTQDIDIMVGTPIIARMNYNKLGIFNSEMFEVVKWDKKNITICEADNKEVLIEIKINKFAKYFAIGYCTTIHKYQGSTIDKPFTIHEWDLLDERLKYVALSRTTDKGLINISRINW